MKQLAVDIGSQFGSPFGATTDSKSLGDLIGLILTGAITIAGIIALAMIILGGLSMIAGAGQDNPERAAKGRQAATWGAIGFVIIFASYWIIRILEIITGSDFLTDPGKILGI